MTQPEDFPERPRVRTPVFYGSFDWHSCVEMHWLLVRLLRTIPDAIPAQHVRQVLGWQFRPAALAAESQFMAQPEDAFRQRPYGWGWALALIDETARLIEETPRLDEAPRPDEVLRADEALRLDEASRLDDGDRRRWVAAMQPLGEVLTDCFLTWLPKATYPLRYGLHSNSAFGLSRALPYAQRRAAAGDPRLADAITAAARRWFAADAGYPAGWEPSGHDFLSPALTEAELMARILPGAEFAAWLDAFLPGIAAAEPASIFTPATVSDSSDGAIAHLHGLNLSRAWCWRRLAETLPPDDPRVPAALAAAARHAEASLPHVEGDHYMVEHWLAAYAVLLLS